MTDCEVAELGEHTEHRRWRHVADIVERAARKKLDGSLFPQFKPLLTVTDYVIYKYAIVAVGKMKQPAAEAFDAVLEAWQTTWFGGCPQCSIEALGALVKLNPHDPRLVEEIKRCLAVDNYQVHKDCAQALMTLNDRNSRQVLHDFESYLPRQYSEKLMVDLLAKIRHHLAGP